MNITRECFNDLSNYMAKLWREQNKELLSCFKDGTDGTFETLAAYMSVEPTDPAILAAMDFNSENPDRTFMEAVTLNYNRAFLTLWDRGALTRLLIDEEIPASAQRDLDRIAAAVEAAKPRSAVVQEVVVPVAPTDPVDICVRDFHELGSSAFKTKWISNTKNRVFYEQACDRNLL